MVLSVKYALVNSTKVPLEGPPGRLGWHLHHFLADPSLKHWKPFLHGGGRRQMVMKCNLKKNSKPCVSLKLEKHLLKTGEANSDQKDQGKVTRALSCGSAGKESACNARDLGLIPGLGRSPGEGKYYPLQYSGLENPMDCIVHGVTKSWTWLSDFHFHQDHLQGFWIDSWWSFF